MPELPEAEVIARCLRQGGLGRSAIVGCTITRAELFWRRTLATPARAVFLKRLPGQVIRDVGRRGKFILLHLSQDTLLIHLRMSGDLLVEPDEAPIASHHRLILRLDNGQRLAFNDPRKFGRVWLVADPTTVLNTLGPEPLDLRLTSDDLYHRLQAHRRSLKPLLVDQTFLAGLGNIYSDEALHLAGLHPLSKSQSVTVNQTKRLWSAIRKVLREGIRRNGASIDWVYRGGEFQNFFQVYRRTGRPCYRCGTPIKRIIVGQRGTHYCPMCQPEPDECSGRINKRQFLK